MTGRRSHTFERWWNVRDLGGLPLPDGGTTRRGVLVRAASPSFATPADIARGRELGLMTFVDLRMPGHGGDWRDTDPGVTTIGVDLVGALSRPADIAAEDVLAVLLEGAHDRVAAAVGEITRLAETSPPVVFHCHTGKDRTGLISMLMLSLAGVADEAIIDDYLASNPGFEEMREALIAELGSDFMPGAPASVRGPVPREGAEKALQALAAAGGAAAYLESGGLTPDQVRAAAGLLR